MRDGRLHLDRRVIPLAGPVRERLAAWLDDRARRWPATVNPHLFINWYTAVRESPVSSPWISHTLGWRDTKAALLLFIRSGQPTAIISKSIKEIERHPNYKGRRGDGQDGERYDFVLHANGDPNKEIQLAFLPFALKDTQDQP